MNNKKRLVFTISKCRTQNFEMHYCISNNQGKDTIWIKKPDFFPGSPTSGKTWSKFSHECTSKIRRFLIAIKAVQQDYQNMNVVFNKEDYFVLAAPHQKKDWLDYKMAVQQDEIDFFFRVFIGLRTQLVDNLDLSWEKVISA